MVALGAIGDTRAVAPLVGALQERRLGVGRAAVAALGAIGDARAVEPVVATLSDPDEDVRTAAAASLGRIGDGRAVEPLVAALADPGKGARDAAEEALKGFGPAAAGSLAAALAGGDPDLRRRAAGLLQECGWQPDRTVAGAAFWAGLGEWARCVEIGAPAVGPLADALGDEDWRVRQGAAAALGAIGAAAIEPLVRALGNPGADVRSAAATALVALGALAVEPLVAALRDRDAHVRSGAATSLGGIGDRRAVVPLVASIRDGDRAVRWSAIHALGQIGDVRAAAPVAAAVRADWSLWWAAEAFGPISGPGAVDYFVGELHSPISTDTRRDAARALVTVYEAGLLDAQERQRVLTQRARITEKHVDGEKDSDCFGHADNGGIDVEFPL